MFSNVAMSLMAIEISTVVVPNASYMYTCTTIDRHIDRHNALCNIEIIC